VLATATATVFQRETLAQVWAEALPLLAEQARELAPYPDIAFNPDRVAYEQAEQAGMLRIFTVRVDGVLAGYAVFFIRTNPHYCDSLQAVQDVLWLAPAYRRGGLGLQLIASCDTALKAEGVQVVLHHAKLKSPALGQVLLKLGYEPIDTIYTKRLDR